MVSNYSQSGDTKNGTNTKLNIQEIGKDSMIPLKGKFMVTADPFVHNPYFEIDDSKVSNQVWGKINRKIRWPLYRHVWENILLRILKEINDRVEEI